MSRRVLLGVGGTAIVLLSAGSGSARQAPSSRSAWRIRDLGTLPAPFSRNSEADRINNRGQVLGWSAGTGAHVRGVVWSAHGRAALGGSAFVQTRSINERGDAVGIGSVTHDARMHVFVWRHDGVSIDLTSRYGVRGDVAAVNDSGGVVGSMRTARGKTHAFLWKGGRVIDLGTLGGESSYATAINDHGDVVGQSETATGAAHAFIWRSGKMAGLGTVPSHDSAATAINDRGDVVGYAQVGPYDPDHVLLWRNGRMVTLSGFGPGGIVPEKITNRGAVLVDTVNPEHAFIWRDGQVTDLGSLGGGATHAYDMNEKNQVVGSSKVAPIHRAAFFWSNGKMMRLPALARGGGPPYTTAFAINNRGEIVGASYVGRIGRERAVRWTLRR
jgi:probable HAF family extracellular repeat protein